MIFAASWKKPQKRWVRVVLFDYLQVRSSIRRKCTQSIKLQRVCAVFRFPSGPPEKPPMPATVTKVKQNTATAKVWMQHRCFPQERKKITLFHVVAAHRWAWSVGWPGVHRRHGNGETGGADEERCQHNARLGVSQLCQSRDRLAAFFCQTLLPNPVSRAFFFGDIFQAYLLINIGIYIQNVEKNRGVVWSHI